MQTTLIRQRAWPAIAAFCLAQASAQAQTNNVSLYGVLDIGVSHTSDVQGASLNQVATRHESSFWGVRGREDLGGGTSAYFQFERTLTVATGADGVRSALVGLSDKSWGTITMGRQYDLLVDQVQTDPARQNSITTVVPGNYDRSLGNYLDSSIKYKSPAFGNVVFGAMATLAPDAPNNAGRARGLNAMYEVPGTRVVATILKVDGITARPYNDLGVNSMFGIGLGKDRTRTVAMDQSIVSLAAYHDVDKVRLLFNYSDTTLQSIANGRKEHYRALRLGGYTPVKQGLKVGVGASVSTLSDARWVNVHAIATYVFSPRTEVYLRAVTQRASGPQQAAALFLEGPSSTTRQTVIGAGLTHRF